MIYFPIIVKKYIFQTYFCKHSSLLMQTTTENKNKNKKKTILSPILNVCKIEHTKNTCIWTIQQMH